MDWNSPLIYDINVNDEGLVEVSSLSYNQENGENWATHHVFDESPNSEVSWLGLEKINYVDFLGVENFLSCFPNENLDVGFGMLEENLIFCGQEVIDHFWEFFYGG